MKLNLPALALGVILAASPALAKPSPNATQLTEHLVSLRTPTADACMDPETENNQRIAACQAALVELDRTRKNTASPSIGQKANFDFLEASLQLGLAAAYANTDNGPSQRGCTALERMWVLRHGLTKVPESELPAEAYEVFQNPPEGIGPILQVCRKQFGTPEGAPKPPAN